MSLALAHTANHRTAIKAAIKRGSAQARAAMNRLDRDVLGELDGIYRRAAANIAETIRGYAGSDGSVRLEVLRDLQGQVNSRIEQMATLRNQLLEGGQANAASLGVGPFAHDPLVSSSLNQIADEAVRFTRRLVAADGLQLSDRLWRLDNGARESVSRAIESAVIQGHSASRAATDLLNRGQTVPADLLAKQRLANADGIATNTTRALLHGDGNPRAAAMRVMRTELNRAHGEAYMAGGEEIEDFAGWRFLLSPRHPAVDICDMHARANLHGLGPGVYPSRDRCPWPAHPNTLSYVEIVFLDEVTDEDQAGKVGAIDWLKGQPTNVQDGVLASRIKRVALQKGILQKNEIRTPWRVLKNKYEKKGFDVAGLTPQAVPVATLRPPLLTGQVSDDVRRYTQDAFSRAPDEVHGFMRNAPPLSSLRIEERGQSYYQGGRIVLSKTSMKTSVWRHSEYTVYRHEYGHHLDFSALTVPGSKYPSQISYTSDKLGGLGDTMNRAKKSLHARSAAQKQRFRDLRARVSERDGTIQDLFGSLTKNRMGGGHSNAYLSNPGFAETEVFAQLFELYCRSDQSGWKFVAAELPELTDNFSALVKRMGRA